MKTKTLGRPKKHAIFNGEDGAIMAHYYEDEKVKFLEHRESPTVEMSMELDHYLTDTDGHRWKIADNDRYITVHYEREEDA